MPEKQKQRFLNPKGEFPGRTLKLMKDLKAHKKATSGSGKEAGRQNKGFPDIETLILALVASVTSASRVMAFLQNSIAPVAAVGGALSISK